MATASTAIRMSMWKNDFVEFEIDVQEGWMLHLGTSFQVEVIPGHKFGRLSIKCCGLELRNNKDFITKRPLYVLNQRPHPQLLTLYSARQKFYKRKDCMGYVPKQFRYRRDIDKGSDGESSMDDSDKDDNNEENRDDNVEKDQDDHVDRNKFYYYVLLPDGKRHPMFNCMYLGADISESEDNLALVEIIPQGMYSVVAENGGLVVGYIFLIGVWSPDLKRFRSDEGFCDIGVVIPAFPFPKKFGFMAFLGSQADLNFYELDRARPEVDVDKIDLFSFDQRADRYWVPPPREFQD